MFRILCMNGLVSNMWFMIRMYEHQLYMDTMVCLYMIDFSHCKDHDLILYFQSQLQQNQNGNLLGGNDTRINKLLRSCVLYRNKEMMSAIHSISNVYFHKTLGIEGLKKRSIQVQTELIRYSIDLDRFEVFEYLVKNNTYYNREVSSLVNQCVISQLPKYIKVLNKQYNLNIFYTGMDVIPSMSVSMYLFMARMVKYPEWFHYEYLLDAIRREDVDRISTSLKQYPYSVCMRYHKLCRLSIGKPWYDQMVTSHPCGLHTTNISDPLV